MKTASISEARNRLSAYINLVCRGDAVRLIAADRECPTTGGGAVHALARA